MANFGIHKYPTGRLKKNVLGNSFLWISPRQEKPSPWKRISKFNTILRPLRGVWVCGFECTCVFVFSFATFKIGASQCPFPFLPFASSETWRCFILSDVLLSGTNFQQNAVNVVFGTFLFPCLFPSLFFYWRHPHRVPFSTQTWCS